LETSFELIDIGLNLTHDSFAPDRDAVLARARDAGVRRAIVTGSDIEHSRQAIALAEQQPLTLRATAGVHPHHAAGLHDRDRGELLDLIRRNAVVAVGECGLDYFRNFSPHADQVRAFRLQLELAVESGKPVFLHQRDAHEDFVAILRDYLPRIVGGVAHCFTGSVEQASAYLEMGLYIGVTGWVCDERRGQVLREAVPHIPLDRLLIETDAPYLLPRDLKPKPQTHRNEPMYLAHVLRKIAELRKEAMAEVARATTENSRRLFGW
jgi:TatD DNase family protein